ncbi:DNA-3-methyladenine glycosylase 2 family protein [Natronospirillum operosum]|uniref:DNA-3-methyladenine glycosylase II n=1 Tax=Natronospirillum operosum TaxID=2759953 RepID=A0A4Z0WDJ7_9GAMM|nr:AlkA N-terminal domain-containing protein [Natronospirillum operosum]TGG93216.1 DNA-3-methyladenine glycosylase 2 family protein [Natronospirillum operosum]
MQTAHYQQARLTRDPRFDGRFFVAVTSTGIYCRPICPAPLPKEENVRYFDSAVAAAEAGFRPCLRCRPDSAPASWAWKGTDTTLERALRLIDEGALVQGSVSRLAERLGISSRYLTRLFQNGTGTSPKRYALYQQLLFAKSLLQQTGLPVAEVAFAAGFGSIRRFNDCFRERLQMTPSDLRRQPGKAGDNGELTLFLSYRPPYNWQHLRDFLRPRLIPGLEWITDHSYGRSLTLDNGQHGYFTATHDAARHGFRVALHLSQPTVLLPVVRTLRRLLDLDADSGCIDDHLRPLLASLGGPVPGLRLPGTLSLFEAGVRAILGQQVSVSAAHKLVAQLVEAYGQTGPGPTGEMRLFPSPEVLAETDLAELRLPGRRKQTLIDLACLFRDEPQTAADPGRWLQLSGIGPWTVQYARMRGLSESDIWLGGDLGVQRALRQHDVTFDPAAAAPWRSYLTLNLWSLT